VTVRVGQALAATDTLRQAVLVVSGGVALDNLTLEWGDGQGEHKPALDRMSVEWGRDYPLHVALDALTVEWADGSGAHKPALDRLTVESGDGHGLRQPTLGRLEVTWDKGVDRRPALSALTVEWSDGGGTHRPALDNLQVVWADGSGAGRPALAAVEVQWADVGPQPPPHNVRLSLLRVEWNDDADPTGGGDAILWITHTTDTPVVGLRVVTDLDIPDGEQLVCLVRCDSEHLPVDAWHSYQKFRANRSVAIERPGTQIRVGVVKPTALPDDTSVFVQLRCEM